MQALEAWPYVGGVLALGYFVGFAMFVPMHSKLLKETVISGLLGLTTAALFPYYYKRIYTTNVCTVYDDLRKAIKLNPALLCNGQSQFVQVFLSGQQVLQAGKRYVYGGQHSKNRE